ICLFKLKPVISYSVSGPTRKSHADCVVPPKKEKACIKKEHTFSIELSIMPRKVRFVSLKQSENRVG
ncbi:hypothetical protein KKE54_03370, partial [bacterium]|nr:hypothetical protein [bacterium]